MENDPPAPMRGTQGDVFEGLIRPVAEFGHQHHASRAKQAISLSLVSRLGPDMVSTMRSTLIAALPLLASCATLPWAPSVKRVSSELTPVPTLSAAYYPGSLVRVGKSGWSVQSRPTSSAGPCVEPGPPVDFEFNIDESFIAKFGAQAPRIGLKAGVGLSDVSEIHVIGGQVSTFDFPVMEFKRGGLRAEIQQSPLSYRKLAVDDELFLVVKTVCATELRLKTSRKSGLGALVSANPAPGVSPVEAQAALDWRVNDDGSISYKSMNNIPICFGVQSEQVSAAEVDDILANQRVCPDEIDLMKSTTEEIKKAGADCIERALLMRRDRLRLEKRELSAECKLAAQKRAEALRDLFAASLQWQDAQHRELCAPEDRKAQLKQESEDALVRFFQTVESVRRVEATGGLTFFGPEGTHSIGDGCPE